MVLRALQAGFQAFNRGCARFRKIAGRRLAGYVQTFVALACLAVARLLSHRSRRRRSGQRAPQPRGNVRHAKTAVDPRLRGGDASRIQAPKTRRCHEARPPRRRGSGNPGGKAVVTAARGRPLAPDPQPLIPPPRRRLVVSEPHPFLRYLDLASLPRSARAPQPTADHQPSAVDPQPPTPASVQPAPGDRPPRRPHPMTEKRRAAQRAATLQAAWAHKRDRSVHYASGFLNGYQVADPSRALALSAATLDEYEAHLAVYDIGLHPVTELQEKLARAAAMASWKWLTGMRLYGDTEVLGVWECLDRLAQERQSPSGVRQELTPQRLMEFARELNHVFERWLGWDEEVAPLDHRLMQLLRQGIVERGAPKQRIKHLRSSPTVENFSAHSAEVLASPGCCAKRVRARLAAEPERRPEKPARGSEAGSKPGGPGNHRSPSQALGLGLAEETVAGS